MSHSVGRYLERILEFEEWTPMALDKEPVSSSAVDLSLLFNRVLVLVKHGVENAYEAFKKGFHTTSLNPLQVPYTGY